MFWDALIGLYKGRIIAQTSASGALSSTPFAKTAGPIRASRAVAQLLSGARHLK